MKNALQVTRLHVDATNSIQSRNPFTFPKLNSFRLISTCERSSDPPSPSVGLDSAGRIERNAVSRVTIDAIVGDRISSGIFTLISRTGHNSLDVDCYLHPCFANSYFSFVRDTHIFHVPCFYALGSSDTAGYLVDALAASSCLPQAVSAWLNLSQLPFLLDCWHPTSLERPQTAFCEAAWADKYQSST